MSRIAYPAVTQFAGTRARGLPEPIAMRYIGFLHDALRRNVMELPTIRAPQGISSLAIACRLGRHVIAERGVRNGAMEYARCDRCVCDLMRGDDRSWKRVPKGFKVVWRPKAAGGIDAAALGQKVDLRGVTIVGERTYGAQRFALVVLDAKDERDYSMIAPRGMQRPDAQRIAQRATARPFSESDVARTESVFDMLMRSKPMSARAAKPIV